MAYVNGTTHYNLPQTVGTDKRDWADTNEAFAAVDAALYGAVDDVAQAEIDISDLKSRMTTAEGNIVDNTADIAGLDTRLTTAEGAITSQQSQITDLRQDTEDMICAYNEASATSTHAYAIGDYFIYNDVLYKATQAIAIGDTIVPDTNCATTNVTTELLALDNSNFVNTDVVCLYVESSATASRNYAIGDYFILNDSLYVVTAAITAGDTITVGSNCSATSISEELISMKNSAELDWSNAVRVLDSNNETFTPTKNGFFFQVLNGGRCQLYITLSGVETLFSCLSTSTGLRGSLSVPLTKGMTYKITFVDVSIEYSMFVPYK